MNSSLFLSLFRSHFFTILTYRLSSFLCQVIVPSLKGRAHWKLLNFERVTNALCVCQLHRLIGCARLDLS